MNDFRFIRYTHEYKDQVIDLLKQLWHFNKEERLKYFKWKYEDNPYSEQPLLFLALNGEKVVAVRGYMLQPMVYKNNTFLEASLADTVTDLKYRRQGLFQNLTEFSISGLSELPNVYFSLNSSSGGPTLNGYFHLGWKPLSERDNIMRFTIKGVLRRLTHTVTPVNLPLLSKNHNGNSLLLTTELRTSDILTIYPKEDFITHKRDTTYYNWRLSNPTAKYIYCYNYNDADNELQSYIILKEISYGKLDLIDFNSKSEKDLKDCIQFVAHKLNPFYIALWEVSENNPIIRHPVKFNFLSTKIILRHFRKFSKPPFLVKEFESAYSMPSEKHSYLQKANWNLFKIIGDEI